MTKKPSTYVVQEGDTLSLIAKRYSTTADKLKELNVRQIKHADYIRAGEVLNLNVGGKRTLLPATPKTPSCNNEMCRSKASANFVDVLYVPVHPVTGKKVWYAVTEEAKTAIKKEQKTLSAAITGDHIQILQNLNDLGILSKFQHKVHSQFLGKEGDKLNLLNVLLLEVGEKGKAIKQGELIKLIIDELGLSYEVIKKNVERRVRISNAITSYSDMGSIELPESKAAEHEILFQKNVLNEVIKDVVWKAKKEVERLTRKAISNAKKIGADDKTHFVYDDNQKFYTSEQQMRIFRCVNKIIQFELMNDDVLKNKTDEYVQDLLFWTNGFENYATYNPKGLYIESYYEYTDSMDAIPQYDESQECADAILYLNFNGYLLKEQCLTLNELVGSNEDADYFGPKTFTKNSKYKDWRHDENLAMDINDIKNVNDEKGNVHIKIPLEELFDELKCGPYFSTSKNSRPEGEELEQLLNNNNVAATRWAYYPTLALIRFIDVTITKRLGDLRSAIGVSPPQFFDNLLWIKKIALARVDQLKSIAHRRAKAAESIQYLFCKNNMPPRPDGYTLLWDLRKYKPLEKNTDLYTNKAGKADIQVVECALLSENDKIAWVRGPAWYLPEGSGEDDASLGHVKDITHKVAFVDSSANINTTTTDRDVAWNDIKKGLKNGATISQLKIASAIKHADSAFWGGAFHHAGGESGGKPTYTVDAQAQFLRYSVQSTQMAELPLSRLNELKPKLFGNAERHLKLGFDLARGQVDVAMTLPADKKNGHPLIIHYVARGAGGKDETKPYNVGSFITEISANLYGYAGVSLLLSGSIGFGQSATDGGIGVKGREILPVDFNQLKAKGRSRTMSSNPILQSALSKKVAADASVKVDLFMGVEAGVASNAKCLWRPPVFENDSKGKFLLLGSVVAQVSVGFGLGITGDIKLAYHKGCIVLHVAARAVLGVGAFGCFSVTLDAVVADRFIGCLLSILKESGFKYIDVLGSFDKNGNNDAFELLNTYLTASLIMRLALADVFLLPVAMVEEYCQEALQEKHSIYIARYLLQAANNQANKDIGRWIHNLPPEVLAKLLNCLCTEADGKLFEFNADYIKRIASERLEKAQAIALMFQWLAPKEVIDVNGLATNWKAASSKEINHCCNQFEKTLILMEGHAETAATYSVKWERFGKAWTKISSFVLSIPTSTKNKKKGGVLSMKKDINKVSEKLGKNMQGYRFTLDGIDETIAYLAHRKQPKNAPAPPSFKTGEQSMDELNSLNAAIARHQRDYEKLDLKPFENWEIK